MAFYQLQLKVSGKWLDCGAPLTDMTEAVIKYREREEQKTGDDYRLLRVEVIRPVFDGGTPDHPVLKEGKG